MKAHFIRKPSTIIELIPQDEFIIEKEVLLDNDEFYYFLENPLLDYIFIKDNIDVMYIDEENVWHAIFVTTEDSEFGVLIQSDGYSYCRYVSYLHKNFIEKNS